MVRDVGNDSFVSRLAFGSMEFLRTTYLVNVFFSAVPLFRFETKSVVRTKFSIVYSACTAIAVIGLYIFSTFFLHPYDKKVSTITSEFLDVFTSALLLISTLIIITNPVFQTKKWKNLLRELMRVTAKLEQRKGGNEPKCISIQVLKLVGLHLLIVSINTVRLTTVYNINAETESKYFFCGCLYEYYCFTSTVLMIEICMTLKQRYKILSELLETTVGNGTTQSTSNKHIAIVDQIRRISKIYKMLNYSVDVYNDIFGYQTLFMIGNTLLSVLQSFDACLRYSKLRDKYGDDTINILIPDLTTTFFNLVKLSVVVDKR